MEKEEITNPSMGSNDLGTETDDEYSGVSAGSDTQLMLTALGGKKHRATHETNDDDKEKEKNKAEFLERNKVDE